MKVLKKSILVLSTLLLIGTFLMIHFVIPTFLINTRIGVPQISLPENPLPHQNLTCTSFDSLKLDGLYFKSKNDSIHKTVIILHGIRSSKEYNYPSVEHLISKGVSVLLIDHRAHGKSEGDYCTFGVKEKYDVQSWINIINNKYPNDKIGVWGQSLGGAIGLQAMGIDKRIEFAVIECTFSELKTVGPDYINRMFGVNWKWLNEYIDWRAGTIGDFKTELANPLTYCQKITQPILLAHGNKDENINIKYGRKNYAALKSLDKTFIEVDGAGHNTLWKKGGEDYSNKVFSFILRQ